MLHPPRDDDKLLSALDVMFSKYFEEKDDPSKGKSPEGKFWGTYMRAMKDEDEQRPRDWDGSTGSILTFSGLFAATVAAFVIESSHSLSPDSGDQTVYILSQLLNATTKASTNSVMGVASPEPFRLQISAVLVNVLWYCSLLIVLACALLATLVQQWSREYTRDIQRRVVLDESLVSRAYNHVYIRMGVDRYGMDEVVNLLVSLVHLSVILFAVGLMLFLFPLNSIVAWCSLSVLLVFGLATPLTYPLAFGHWLLGRMSHYVHDTLLQKDMSSLVEAFLAWCVSVLPPASTQVAPKRRAVYLYDEDDTFLSVMRFKFAWLHTSRQMFDGDFKALLQFVMTRLASMSEDLREECILHLTGDEQLRTRFRPIGSYWLGSSDYEADVMSYQMCCILFQRFYDGHQSASLYERDDMALRRYLQVVLSGATTSSITAYSAMSTLRTRLCLFYMRWYLLIALVDVGVDGHVMEWDVVQMMSYIFQGHGEKNEMEAAGDELTSQTYHRIIGRPWTLLRLLNSWSVNSMDAMVHTDQSDLEETARRSCLVPLHDDRCCRDSSITGHIAACNALTMIAHLLRAPEGERMELLRQQSEYDRLFNHGDSPFVCWINDFEVKAEERQRAPSAEFIEVLLAAKLHDWLSHNSSLDYSLSHGSPERRLLLHRLSDHGILDQTSVPPSTIFTVVDVLRALARRVNFNALVVVASQTHPPDPDVGANVEETSIRETKSGRTSGSSADPSDQEPFAEVPVSPVASRISAEFMGDTPYNVQEPLSAQTGGSSSLTSDVVISSTTMSPGPGRILSYRPEDDQEDSDFDTRKRRKSPQHVTEQYVQLMAEWQHSFGSQWEEMTMHERWDPFEKRMKDHIGRSAAAWHLAYQRWKQVIMERVREIQDREENNPGEATENQDQSP
ncbi:unnamed protein product [Peniophora sp. CBMAI 1063]|nr:unnamed protein product [Peniophora sp. CBMAI 1063]